MKKLDSQCLSDELLDQYHSGELDPESRASVEAHLKSCESCASRDARLVAECEGILHVLRKLNEREDASLQATMAPPDGAQRRSLSGPVFPRIEGYEIHGILGSGGMGIVYVATQLKLGRRVALKVLPAVVSSAQRDLVERFRREAAAASRLHHTNIIPIYDFGESRDGYYYAMELLDGHPMSTIIKRLAAQQVEVSSPTDIAAVLGLSDTAGLGTESESEASSSSRTGTGASSSRGRFYYRQVATWIASVAEALHYAHLRSLIHRDIKPGNIVLCRDGRIVVVDFGLVKEAGSESVTATGSLVGTYRYMSPEQIGAKRIAVDARTDVYSLGATLYELLTFQPAFPATEQSELLGQILWKEPTPPRKFVPSVPVDLQTICLKAMEKSPARRYASAGTMADDLRKFIDNLPIQARPIGTIGRIARLVRRRPMVSAMAGVVLLLGVSLLTIATFYTQAVKRGTALKTQVATLNQKNTDLEQLVALLRKTVVARQGDDKTLVGEIQKILNGVQNQLNQGNLKGAQMQYDRAVALNGKSISVLYRQAHAMKELYYKDGDRAHLDHANELLKDLAEPAIENVDAWNLKAIILRELGKPDDAINVWRRLLLISKDDHTILVNLGGALAVSGDLRAARGALQDGVHNDDRTTGAMPRRNLAALLHYEGETEEAWDELKSEIETLRDGNGNLRSGELAFCALLLIESKERRDLDAALTAARDATNPKLGPSEAAERVLALALLRQSTDQRSNASDAKKAAEAAVEMNQKLDEHRRVESHARMLLALAEARLGNREAAKDEQKKADDLWRTEAVERKPEAEENAYVCRVEQGFLWFVSKEDMDQLRDEIQKLIP